MRSQEWGRSLCILGLTDPAPGCLIGSMTADNSRLHDVPFHGKLPDGGHAYTFGASVGCPFHGQGASGDRVGPGEGTAGIKSLKGLFRGVLFTKFRPIPPVVRRGLFH